MTSWQYSVGVVVVIASLVCVACSVAAEPSTPTPEPIFPTPPPWGTLAYSGPECPGRYPNCAPIPSDDSFLFLGAYRTNDINGWSPASPDLTVFCIGRSPLVYLASRNLVTHSHDLTVISDDLTVTVVASPELTGHFSPLFSPSVHSATQMSIYFGHQEAVALTDLMKRIEASGRPYMRVVVGAVNSDEIVADFDITGMAVNLSRVGC